MATTTNAGRDFFIWNFTLSTSDTTIILNQYVSSLTIRCRTGVDLYLRRSQGDSSYMTIPSGGSLSLDISTKTLQPLALRAASGSPVVEILGTQE